MKPYASRWYYILFSGIWGYMLWQIFRGNPEHEFRSTVLTLWIGFAVVVVAFIIYNEIRIKKYKDDHDDK